MRWSLLVAAVAALAALVPNLLPAPTLKPDLVGSIAVVTGGSQGAGRGIAMGLGEAGATVYITGRTERSLQEACALVPGTCIAKIVDSANDTSLEIFFEELLRETGGRLDILVNNAYSAVAYWHKNKLLGKPFWETPIQLFDEVFDVGVRSHYKASQLAMKAMLKRKQGLIVNVNSPGCTGYLFNVPYGMGKCAIDKMTTDFAMEASTENVDIVTLWPGLLPTAEVRAGGLDGIGPRRGADPNNPLEWDPTTWLGSALAETLLLVGRAVAHHARDPMRSAKNGRTLIVADLARYYGFTDERGVAAPGLLSIKSFLFLGIPSLFEFAKLPDATPFSGKPTATQAQEFVFNKLPNMNIPKFVLTLLGPPVF